MMPYARQMYPAAFGAQLNVFPADVKPEAAATFMDVTLAAG